MYPIKDIELGKPKTKTIGKLVINTDYVVHTPLQPCLVYHLSDTQKDGYVVKNVVEPLVSLDQTTPRLSCGRDILSCFYLNKAKLLDYVFMRAKTVKSRWFTEGMILSAFETRFYIDPVLSKVDRHNEEVWLVDSDEEGTVFKPVQQLLVSFLDQGTPDCIDLILYNPSDTFTWRLTEDDLLGQGKYRVTLKIHSDQEDWLTISGIQKRLISK